MGHWNSADCAGTSQLKVSSWENREFKRKGCLKNEWKLKYRSSFRRIVCVYKSDSGSLIKKKEEKSYGVYGQFKEGCRFRMNDFSSSFWVNGPRWRTPIGEQTTSESPTENSFWLLPPPWSKEATDDTGSPRNPFKSSEVCGEWDDESSHFRLFRCQMGVLPSFLFHRHSANKWSITGLFLFMKKMAAQCATLISHLVFIWPCIWNSPSPDAFLAYRVTWNATLQQDPGKNTSVLGFALKRSFCSREQMCNTSFTYKGTLLTWINWNEKRVVSQNTLAETIT